MSFTLDARIPVVLGKPEEAGADDALLLEGDGPAEPGKEWFQADAPSAHSSGCACCLPRSSADMAFARLILARGRGTGPFFKRVIAVTSTIGGLACVKAALERDPLTSACYKAGCKAVENRRL